MMHINQFHRHNITLYLYLLGRNPQIPTGALPLAQLGDFHPPGSLLSCYTPCHYILDKGLGEQFVNTVQTAH